LSGKRGVARHHGMTGDRQVRFIAGIDHRQIHLRLGFDLVVLQAAHVGDDPD
jgi:hypothetical protein